MALQRLVLLLGLVWQLLEAADAADAANHAAASATPQEIQSLRDWLGLLGASLREMERLEAGSAGPCLGASGATPGGLRPKQRLLIEQDVQRYGAWQRVEVQGNDHGAALASVGGEFQAERLELRQRERQVRQLLAFLEGQGGAEPFSEAEVREQARRAAAATVGGRGAGTLARVEVRLAAGGGEAEALTCAALVKPAAMFGGLPRALANPADAQGRPLLPAADLSQASARAVSLYVDSFTAANDMYARAHPLITYVWLYVLNLWAIMVPCSGSGPFMPEASCNSCSMGFLPWSRMFGPGVSCASPLGIITETANPGASVWSEFSEFGLLTFSPRPMARSSCWMLPVVGQVGQIIPGRMLPDRTVFGSHPSGCSNLEGRPDLSTYTETFLARGRQGYDQRLVELLYGLAARNASFARATFYTTSLTQLALLGWYPRSAALQHHGVQLTLRESSPNVTASPGPAPPVARVLTLEMMAEGLLWSLRDRELGPKDVHSTEAYDFERVAPEVVADYVLDQRGTTYRDANCQDYARNLMDRLLVHGRGLKGRGQPVVSTRPEYTRRFVALLAALALVAVASAASQWAFCVRTLLHLRSAASEAKGSPAAGLRLMAAALAEDAQVLERRAAEVSGSPRAAALVRRAVVLALMVQSPPVFWYVTGTWWQERRRQPKVAAEPLLAAQ